MWTDLSPEQRRAILDQPIVINVIGRKPYYGTRIAADPLPTEGRRLAGRMGLDAYGGFDNDGAMRRLED